MTDSPLQVRVHHLMDRSPGTADAVRILDLRPVADTVLPSFEAGAHIDIHAGAGIVRQYSLLNDPAETHRYVVAVALDAESRGGSRWIHDWVEPDDLLTISAPRCHFHLVEDAAHSVLIAGGIGITPIWAMAQRLMALGRSFELHYGARRAATAPLLDDMVCALQDSGRFHTRFEESDGRLDLKGILAAAPAGSHVYACGPAAMLDAYLAASQGLPSDCIHYERFAATIEAASEGGFTVELARRQMKIDVQSGQTILDALKTAGVNAPHSCAEGICGACETAILSGVADHRDSVLSDAEKAAGKTMMICCSGAKTPNLVLDL
ncbi:PDR/VanB family oxidoreductase [Asticcacaulis sp. EMRT-3]|uniref:PDR/VanB family oxidoreductase n=1 Tax=Asticcacaulis sp. EMRT-3 TaxID=3040349 RepID=UPI0024AEA394|nr:PDR/VanB family oxidoreductase [Asticcacaulis sp. EMRT-3]MDI7773900.1 PDR/VanB family oxidoreductase [Asticcacaulis sp. EMRT-3]